MADIQYTDIIKRAWYLTKTHKWLWVYGLVIAALSGGSSSGGSSGIGDTDTPADNPQDQQKRSLLRATTNVLGAATSKIEQWISSVSPVSIITFVVIFLALILFYIIATWILRSWAKGALIRSIKKANDGGEVTLAATAALGFPSIKRYMLYDVVAGIISLGIIIIGLILVIGFIVLGTVLFSNNMLLLIVWYILAAVWAVVWVIIILFFTTMTSIYADRLIAYENKTAWNAWKQALKLAKTHWAPTVILGGINTCIGCLVGCGSLLVMGILVIVPILIAIVPLFTKGFEAVSLPLLIVAGGWIFIIANLYVIIGAILTVYKFASWNLLYKELIGEPES